VLWEKEVDAEVLGEASWKQVAEKGFDAPPIFSAYLHTLRWNCVTATDPRLFQAPWRAGIQVLAYQLEPLRKALLLPRVNLFIADDVGLGKTIEAGLILRELMLRQKARRMVVACPSSVVLQWRDELETRFGLGFAVFNRDFVLSCRRERGYGVNPWNTHTRFIISHALLRDEEYAAPLRDWLGEFAPGSLLILDEAHNAAPASGAKYAIDSHLTRVIRDLAPRFEHRLFLSATPHNGHSNSFAALLELLDPQRFCRGVPVKSPKLLDQVMVRRLKSDLREIEGCLPVRRVVQVDIEGLSPDAPELRLARLLDEYSRIRAERLRGESMSVQSAAALVTTHLQKRLFSSIEAFARTLRVHRQSIARADAARPAVTRALFDVLREAPGADDDRADLPEADLEAEADAAVDGATRAAPTGLAARETALLDEMTSVSGAAQGQPDARVVKLVEWLRENLCPGGRWNDRRVLIFTEYTDTKRYLDQQLRAAIEGTDRADERIATFHGGMGEESREEVKRAFNGDPAAHPLRILIATDSAREGVNLQNHCADLFHFDVPWNPSRMEQRNGRIDRKLQRAPEVRCHYFFYKERPEDSVLQALVHKTDTIHRELGSLSAVLDRRLESLLERGIRRAEAGGLAAAVEREGIAGENQAVVEDELEAARKEALAGQLDRLRDLLDVSQRALGLREEAFRDALSCALNVAGAVALQPVNGAGCWAFPPVHEADGSWHETVDLLRAPRRRDQKLWDWRRDSPPRPVTFADTGSLDEKAVHLHLEHRVAQRLLGRFLSQGFVYHDLSRACVGHTRDAIPRVILLGRLSLYGRDAARLHDEIVPVTARWTQPDARRDPLKPFAAEAEQRTLDLLEDALDQAERHPVADEIQKRMLAAVERDMAELRPHLGERARETGERARRLLDERGRREAQQMEQVLEAQDKAIRATLGRFDQPQLLLQFDDDPDAKRQLEADRRHWHKRLAALEHERRTEPQRIRETYDVRATRLEPVGFVYLWPLSG
jgi:superfamily II DNA or RNA helicase